MEGSHCSNPTCGKPIPKPINHQNTIRHTYALSHYLSGVWGILGVFWGYAVVGYRVWVVVVASMLCVLWFYTHRVEHRQEINIVSMCELVCVCVGDSPWVRPSCSVWRWLPRSMGVWIIPAADEAAASVTVCIPTRAAPVNPKPPKLPLLAVSITSKVLPPPTTTPTTPPRSMFILVHTHACTHALLGSCRARRCPATTVLPQRASSGGGLAVVVPLHYYYRFPCMLYLFG